MDDMIILKFVLEVAGHRTMDWGSVPSVKSGFSNRSKEQRVGRAIPPGLT